jgi:tetratricopeptide (TPR) repeat protein
MTAAAPVPQPEPDPGSDDGWALLDALRRRLDDQIAQTRRTQDQVSQLAESIAALVAIQRRRSRWLNLNSFVAYLIFTMLLGAGFYFLYHSRANELIESREAAVGERDTAVRRADDGAAKLAARDKAEAKAWEVYQLLEQGKRGEIPARIAALRDLPLSRTERAVVTERAQQSQVLEIDAALKAAVASFKAGRFSDVIAPLENALKTEPASTSRAATMHYYLGVAYAKGDAKPAELDKAATHVQAALNADVDQEDARFQLASILDRNGAYAKARAEYDRFATAHPQSPLALFAMRRSVTLARMPATAPVVAPVPAAKPPTPAPPIVQPKLVAPPVVQPKVVAPPTPIQPVSPPSPPTAPPAGTIQDPFGSPHPTPPPTTNGEPMAVLDGPPTTPVPDPERRTRRLRPKAPTVPPPPQPVKPEPPAPPPTPTPPSEPSLPAPAPLDVPSIRTLPIDAPSVLPPRDSAFEPLVVESLPLSATSFDA